MADLINEIGFVGLGRMGFNMVSRILQNSKIRVVVYNRSKEPVQRAVDMGAESSESIKELVRKLKRERKVVWLMLPAGEITENHFQEILNLLDKRDVIIDGGNANFQDSKRRHEQASKKGIDMLDVGVSGGVVAAERGYSMMVGGKKEVFEFVEPVFKAMCIEKGYNLVSEKSGSGHYVKMIHNAIEYGMMQAIGEGFDLLKNGSYKDLELEKIARVWNNGTIINSFLMEMTENSLKNNGKELEKLEPWIDDSGEGQWASQEAIIQEVPFVANTYALHARRISRDDSSYAFKIIAAMRNEFGGHAVKKKDE